MDAAFLAPDSPVVAALRSVDRRGRIVGDQDGQVGQRSPLGGQLEDLACLDERYAIVRAHDDRLLAQYGVGQYSGRRCVFCGLNPSPGVPRRMLLAGHIKPWKDSSASERLDPRNGLAACPSHDVAFDTGMLTVSADLKIQIARPLTDAVRGDRLTRQYYGRPPLLDTLLLPDDAERPRRKYLDWHREKVFVA
jgi:putative restriction endonuclease